MVSREWANDDYHFKLEISKWVRSITTDRTEKIRIWTGKIG